MPTIFRERTESQNVLKAVSSDRAETAQRTIAWSSAFFALLQSICTAVIAINTVRLAIGLSSLVMTVGAGAFLVRFHADWIRIPMMTVALLGSLINLSVLFHVRRLRRRPASRWRQRPLTQHAKRSEREQLVLSIVSLALIFIEEYFHYLLCHTL
ncbi:hypothetical protein [Granulicella sp. dw_53]|uniref:hypothetical protein n=1 Tax=Granulicella sp. dw_53 TaxID=2719792 RepID=UPI001BD5EE6D|nr:hypothetical protein [Granulicella sp. dw_53]